ncbi:hypothetical protein TKK_0001934 [Trichogramma kaykai]
MNRNRLICILCVVFAIVLIISISVAVVHRTRHVVYTNQRSANIYHQPAPHIIVVETTKHHFGPRLDIGFSIGGGASSSRTPPLTVINSAINIHPTVSISGGKPGSSQGPIIRPTISNTATASRYVQPPSNHPVPSHPAPSRHPVPSHPAPSRHPVPSHPAPSRHPVPSRPPVRPSRPHPRPKPTHRG